MIRALTLAALCTAPVQDTQVGPGAAPPPGGEGWQLVDAVIFQAGDEPILHSEVWTQMRRVQLRMGISIDTEAEQLDLLNRSLDSLVTLSLEAQAGEDREADPAGLEDRISQFLSERRHNEPLRDYVDSLEQSGVSAQSEVDVNKAGYYQSSFRSQGKIGPRPTRDGYIRPGELREYYRVNGQVLLGGESSYRFQDLVIQVAQVGDVQEARILAEELRRELQEGADFGEIHDQYGTTQIATRGVTERFGPDNPLPDPEARAFGEGGEVGEVSSVMAIPDPRSPGEVVAFRVLRLFEKAPGTPPPPFETELAQDGIRDWLTQRRDDRWLNHARSKLRGTTYLWPSPEEPPPPLSGAVEEAAEGSEGSTAAPVGG